MEPQRPEPLGIVQYLLLGPVGVLSSLAALSDVAAAKAEHAVVARAIAT